MVHLLTDQFLPLSQWIWKINYCRYMGYFVICNSVICKLSPKVGEGQRWEPYVLKNTQQGKIWSCYLLSCRTGIGHRHAVAQNCDYLHTVPWAVQAKKYSVLIYMASIFMGHHVTELVTSDEGPERIKDEFEAVSSKGHVWIYHLPSPRPSTW